MEDIENWISESYYRAQWNQNEERKGKWGIELTRAKECERY